MVMAGRRDVWAVELKAAGAFRRRRGAPSPACQEAAGRNFKGGVMLRAGTHTLATGDPRILAVPWLAFSNS